MKKFLFFVFFISSFSFCELIGYWKLDEGKGNIALDYSGKGNAGEIINAFYEKTERGNAIRFSTEKKSYIIVSDGAWNFGEGTITFLFWIKVNGPGKGNAAIEHAHTGAVPGSFTVIDWGKIGFSVYDDMSKEKTVWFKNAKYNQWHFIGIVWKKAKDGYIKAYLDGEEVDKIDVSCITKTPGSLYFGARGEVPDQFMDGYLKEVAVFNHELSSEEIKGIYEGKPLIKSPLVIGFLGTDKIYYDKGEDIEVNLILRNIQNENQKGEIVLNTVSYVNERKNYLKEEIEFKPDEIKEIKKKIKLNDEMYGVQLEAIVKCKDSEVKAYSYFATSDNLWKVSIGAGSPSNSALYTETYFKNLVKSWKENYINWFEVDFWAPDDWGYMTPKEEKWVSGQAARYESKNNLKFLINEAHKYGIKAITYGKGIASAPWGMEIARKNPEWFLNGLDGLSMWGYYDVWQVENWNKYPPNSEERKKYFTTNWMPLFPNFRNIEALDWGINELINSSLEFGWDGVRFDGQFSVSDPLLKPDKEDDEFSTFNMQRMKEKIWEKIPNYLFGYNWSYHPDEFYDEIRKGYLHEMEESLAGGGLYMQEAINTFRYGYGRQYKKWSEYYINETIASDIVRKKGGIYQYIYNIRAYKPSTRLYKFILGTSLGTHQAYGDHLYVGGCSNCGKFLTRWSFLFWSDRLNRILKPAELLEIGNDDNREIWWENNVYEYIAGEKLRYIIIHLINPPTDDEIGKEEIPLPIKKIKISFNSKSGEKVIDVFQISSDLNTEDFSQRLNFKYGKVEIPELKIWSIIVFKIESTKPYKVELNNNKFTKKPEVSLEIANKKYEEFINESRENRKKGISIWRAVDRGWNSHFAIKNDIEAKGGVCAVVDYKMGGGTMYAAYYPDKWGIYKATWRIKIEDVNDDINIVLRASPSTKSSIKENYAERKISVNDFKEKGKYEEFSLEFSHIRIPGFYTALTASIGNCKKGTVYIDTVKVEPIKILSDKEIGEKYLPEIKISEVKIPEKKDGLKILVLRGYWWKNYKTEEVAEEIEGEIVKFDVYPDPTKPSYNIFDYNVLILVNYPLNFDDYKFRNDISSFVNSGGKLIILGGMYCLGQGGLKDTIIEDILPVQLKGYGEIIKAEKPLILSYGTNKPINEKPSIYYYHNFIPKSESKILLYAENFPILIERKFGKGKVVVFGGTVLGDKLKDETPFWETKEWIKILKNIIKED